ncbi:tetratricopeptide repeat protein [Anabaena sphaerica FACHB-251]|uniref:Tetratricopeptide repeat protein n=1 Tax=Anabaena sphaerica FACHB-251 TaxID=2692883 RepID=A0A926WKT9_9NOST|nr:tetratricopeptide repeat protein [Anabaena sphaerica]MBD2296461.1 tetratricopeptide repeat protein [Anabaena sphaerica FACHB-251]
MRSENLQELIKEQEGLKLDFKRELHKLYHHDKDYRKKQRDEFIRDILSLTNGNFGTADKIGYLIIGVGDELKTDGTRDLFNVERILNPKQILQRVNYACYPPIPDIHCESVKLDGNNIFLISIPPSPHLHRTTRELITPSSSYPAGTTFIRRNEEIYPATTEECDVILKEKEKVFSISMRRKIYDNIPHSNIVSFLGREEEVKKLYELTNQHDTVAIVGMSGVGKTELANQFVRQHLNTLGDNYGGVCWIKAKNGDAGLQIVSFARSVLGLNPPEDFELIDKLQYCWRNWPSGKVFLVFDDISNYKTQIKPYLPPTSSSFKVLLTARENLGRGIVSLRLDELKREAALKLLESLIDDQERFKNEFEIAEQICKWLGYLPLAIELVGTYLWKHTNLPLTRMLSLLEQKGLEHKVFKENDETLNAPLGLNAVFEVSWENLTSLAQQLGFMLSLFAQADIPWWLIQQAYNHLQLSEDEETEQEKLEEARLDLLSCHLLQFSGNDTYHLHPLIRKFFKMKQGNLQQVNDIQIGFVQGMVSVGYQITQPLSRQQVNVFTPAIPHLLEVAQDKNLRGLIKDDDFLVIFSGLGIFYKNQGFYHLAETWFASGLSLTQEHFGTNNLLVASSLNNLAVIYELQGRYQEAESHYIQALKIRKKLLINTHPDLATSFSNLGDLYRSQGRYEESKPLLLQSLKIRKYVFGDIHPEVATSLNNLSSFYYAQGLYREAEPLLLQSLKIVKKLNGNNHPEVATKLNNLASIYQFQGRYNEAEPVFLQAIEIDKQWYGLEHPEVATDLNNLGLFYHVQGNYKKAESLLVESLEIQQNCKGKDHPDVATTLNCLATLYREQNRYNEAEAMFLQALEIDKRYKAEAHPDIINDLNGLGNVYLDQRLFDKAESLYLKALELARLTGEYQPNMVASLKNLSLLYYYQDRHKEAEPLMLQAFKICKMLLGSNHPETVDCYQGLNMIRHKIDSATSANSSRYDLDGNKSKNTNKPKKFWDL